MATKVAERALLYTNILLAATDEGRSEHARARAILAEWPAAGTVLYTSGQILREYLCVATRPVSRNGLGMKQSDAISNVRALQGRLSLLDEGPKVTARLLQLLDTVLCSGKHVHDANVVATMLVHGVDTLATINVSDFERFADHVTIVEVGPT